MKEPDTEISLQFPLPPPKLLCARPAPTGGISHPYGPLSSNVMLLRTNMEKSKPKVSTEATDPQSHVYLDVQGTA